MRQNSKAFKDLLYPRLLHSNSVKTDSQWKMTLILKQKVQHNFLHHISILQILKRILFLLDWSFFLVHQASTYLSPFGLSSLQAHFSSSGQCWPSCAISFLLNESLVFQETERGGNKTKDPQKCQLSIRSQHHTIKEKNLQRHPRTQHTNENQVKEEISQDLSKLLILPKANQEKASILPKICNFHSVGEMCQMVDTKGSNILIQELIQTLIEK